MLIKYKGGIYKRVDASAPVVEKLQGIIEKRLKAAVELLKVRGLRFSYGKERVRDNLVAFYVTVAWSSTEQLTSKQKDEVKKQLDELLLQGLRPLESIQMFKEHQLRIYSQRWEGNRLAVAMLSPDSSKEAWGDPIEKSYEGRKLSLQYEACHRGLEALHRAIDKLVKEEDSFNGSFEKIIGEISAISPKLAAELKHGFSGLSKAAKEVNHTVEKAMAITKATDFYDSQSIAENVKKLQAL